MLKNKCNVAIMFIVINLVLLFSLRGIGLPQKDNANNRAAGDSDDVADITGSNVGEPTGPPTVQGSENSARVNKTTNGHAKNYNWIIWEFRYIVVACIVIGVAAIGYFIYFFLCRSAGSEEDA